MTLEVYNEPVVEDSTAAAGFALFEDTLNTEWVDASWNAVNTFNSTEQVMEGSTSVKTEQQGWGGLMLRAGSVTAPADFDPTPFENIRFSVYPETPGLSLMVTFENDLRDPFMTNVVSALPTGEWSEIVIPVEQINPTGNSIIHNVMIQNWTPSAKTYFVDDYRFSGNAVTDAGGRPQVPEGYILAQNYPNPFNPTTTIEYELAAEGLVTIQVFNMLGELVATPLDRRASAGRHSLVWDAVGSSGAPLPSGVYTYRLVVAGSGGPVQKTMKMILMK
jgi:hypothetical protein